MRLKIQLVDLRLVLRFLKDLSRPAYVSRLTQKYPFPHIRIRLERKTLLR